jgi:trk system potassium uptake protein TrkH
MLKNFLTRFFTPIRLTVTSFVLVILAGTILLALPVSSNGEKLQLVDVLFVSTSAVCVTGLSPIDISAKLSFFGQCVVLVLMQIGGLGLMTFTTLFSVSFGKRLGIVDRLAIQETFLHSRSSQITKLIFRIVGATLLIEAAGTLLLFVYWLIRGQFESVGQTFFYALFHTVSAFTHGSFALFPDSLIRFQKDFFVISVMTTLIVLGGLGFLVGSEIFDFLTEKVVLRKTVRPIRVSVQTKLTLVTMVCLLFFGTFLLFWTEQQRAFAEMSFFEALINSWFFAVVPRTSGFNTVEMSSLNGASLLLLIILMFIGGTSGSTAGGIKTNTFGLLIAYSFKRLRGENRLHLFKRTIAPEIISRASAIVTTSFAVVIIATAILMLSETGNLSSTESQTKFLPVLFETVSAFGTVGLSLGITAELSTLGKLVLCVVMFVGRIGALSLGLAMSLREKRTDFSYAEENIMIG